MKHKHCDLIKAWADGAKIQIRSKQFEKYSYAYVGSEWRDLPHPTWNAGESYEYRVKPKEAVVLYARISGMCKDGSPAITSIDSLKTVSDNVKLTFDGDSGKLIAAEFVG